ATAYKVFRGEGAAPWAVKLQPVATVKAPVAGWTDPDRARGTVYHYCVRIVTAEGRESVDSVRVRTQPRLVEDAGVSVVAAKEVRLTWKPQAGPDIVGYHVERAPVEVFSEDEVIRLKKDTPPLEEPSVGAIRTIAAFTRLTKEPVKGRAYTDT